MATSTPSKFSEEALHVPNFVRRENFGLMLSKNNIPLPAFNNGFILIVASRFKKKEKKKLFIC